LFVEDRKTAKDGETIIALLNGSHVTLKKFYQENNIVRLQPADSKAKPTLVKPDHLHIQGVIVGVIRKY
jgi:repressor LexA